MSLSKEEVKKVANLARLKITPQEEQDFAGQLSSILDYFEQIRQLDTDNVAPMTRAIDVSNITRSDQQISNNETESLLDSAPERQDDFFRVPKIMG